MALRISSSKLLQIEQTLGYLYKIVLQTMNLFKWAKFPHFRIFQYLALCLISNLSAWS